MSAPAGELRVERLVDMETIHIQAWLHAVHLCIEMRADMCVHKLWSFM